jgi:hypothetical protein
MTQIVKTEKMEKAIILESTITCPHCGHQKEETMPTDACQFLYECENCHKLLRPKPGNCCIYCSYGSVPCPPIQEGGGNEGGC